MTRALALFALLLAPSFALAQNCPNGRCPLLPAFAPVVVAPAGSVAVGDGWHKDSTQDGWYYRSSRPAGCYDAVTGKWNPFNGIRYTGWTTPPAGLRVPTVLNFGIDSSKLSQGYELNGEASTLDAVSSALAAVPDLGNKKRIVVIGTPEDRKAALDVIGTPEWAQVDAFGPDDWYVKEAGYVATGKPTVYVMDADGGVVHRQDDTAGLDDSLQLIGQNKPYDPTKDPTVKPQPVQPAVTPTDVPVHTGSVIGGGILSLVLTFAGRWLLNRFQQSQQSATVSLVEQAVAVALARLTQQQQKPQQ